ncbi:probable ATP-dependent RNA helicase CG8611 [Coccinella septempunctata]|uniref:probable ATP-dependent RNA helicase CG8611 n=1 Tax=Coccinella septempunctata TaxID=41139 RepID=UPI001D08EDA6|nr:probable ATP-dependent RNA helicase CG8611 [Coccinella septempunctata]XP_044757251.1 probable ATP-dependent RNA helicase CG8611 [Coccinella septempunctata]
MTSFNLEWTTNPTTIKGRVLGRKKRSEPKKVGNTSGFKVLLEPKEKESTKSKPEETQKNPTTLAKKKDSSNDTNGNSLENSGKFNKKAKKQTTISRPSENEDKKLVKRKAKKDKVANSSAEQTGSKQSFPSKQDKSEHKLFSEKNKTNNIPNIRGVSVVEKVFSKSGKFSDLDIHKYVLSNLEKHGFNTLTNVQEKAIPYVLKGGDVLIRSQTGSGKTLAYSVPIVDALQSITPRLDRHQGLQALIVVPTRELALQTHEIISKICTFQWIVSGHLCGGENRSTEKNRLRKGVHILVATPGRLLDHILHTSSFKTNNVRCLVLDEADRLLDMGFKKDIIKIVEELDKSKKEGEYDCMALLKGESPKETDVSETGYCLRNPKSKKRQTILLSATLTKGIAELAEFMMKEHTYVDALDESTKINPEHMVIPSTVKQEYIITYVKHRLFTLCSILVAKSKKNCKILVFMATSQMVDFHHELFSKYLKVMPVNRGKLKSGNVLLMNEAVDSDDEDEEVIDAQFFKLHGSMEQARRKTEFLGFKKADKGILLCTDVAARGIDVPEADFVIQYTGPQTDEDYIHRVGRTGRANHAGTALIFLTHDEQDYVTHLQKHKVFLKERDPTEFSSHLCNLMEEPEHEKAALSLQRRFEEAIANHKDLYKMACFAYSSWSRFYNSYPAKLRQIFNFQKVNLGHYVTSFAIKDTPSDVAKVVRRQVSNIEPKRLNKKLATHEDTDSTKKTNKPQKRKIKSICLTTSEFDSGLEFKKKKKS